MTSTDAARHIREWAQRNDGRIASAFVYDVAMRQFDLTRRQTSRALSRSGLYPVRERSNRVVWRVEKPAPWLPSREPGRTPPRIRRRCVTCGRKTDVAGVRPSPVEWE